MKKMILHNVSGAHPINEEAIRAKLVSQRKRDFCLTSAQGFQDPACPVDFRLSRSQNHVSSVSYAVMRPLTTGTGSENVPLDDFIVV
jgi:hypothetical protein